MREQNVHLEVLTWCGYQLTNGPWSTPRENEELTRPGTEEEVTCGRCKTRLAAVAPGDSLPDWTWPAFVRHRYTLR